MAKIIYCDDKVAKNGSNYRVVTFDDDVKTSCYEYDQAKHKCPFWDHLFVGAIGDYTFQQSGAYKNLTGFTPSAGAPTKTEAAVATSQAQQEREKRIVDQTSMKVCAFCAQAKDPAAALEFVLNNYERVSGYILDPFE